MLLNIVQYPHVSLKTTCKQVDKITPDILELLENMAETMYYSRGVGLAANQVNVQLRLVTMIDTVVDDELLKMINPEIVSGDGISTLQEGCLSLPGVLAVMGRKSEVTVKYTDTLGEQVMRNFTGLSAVCVQHEIDHLNAIFFLDKMSLIKRKLALKNIIHRT